MADIEELARRFAASGQEHRRRSPLYASLNRSIANDPTILRLLTAAPEEQQLPALLLAAVHSIVLQEPDIELAAWYPTATDHPLESDPYPAFERLCDARADDIRLIVAERSVQTNEVGRAALLLPGLAAIAHHGEPLSMIDVGTSAGLNLQLDRFEYVYSPGGIVGSPSPVRLQCSTRGSVSVPVRMPEIARRIGIDRHPIDVSDPEARRWLMACVWPDQNDRFDRLCAAVRLALDNQAPIVAGDALDLLPDIVRSAAQHGHPVVTNSWVLNYLAPAAQRSYVAALHELAGEFDLSWVFAESPGQCPELPCPDELRGVHTTAVLATRWRRGVPATQLLGTAHPHGYWWHGPDERR